MEFVFLDDGQQRRLAEMLIEHKDNPTSENAERMVRFLTSCMRPRSTKIKPSKKAVVINE